MARSTAIANMPPRGFTLLETLVALAIYAVLIGTLVVVNRGGLDTLAELESRALARRALANVVTDFRRRYRLQQVSGNVGRYNGEYAMSHFNYRWEIRLAHSQNNLTKLLTADIRLQNRPSADKLATIREIW